ncbi:MAG: hypothetical protein JXO44_06115 [Clostridia bacterium]|nr:hypothetical protein [Clostridia bacterium]
MQKKLRVMTIISAILGALLIAVLPLVKTFVPGEIALAMMKVGGGLCLVAMLTMILGLILNPSWIVKLIALPVSYVLIMVGVILNRVQVYRLLKAMLGLPISSGNPLLGSEVAIDSIAPLMWLLHGGVLIMCIPLILVVMKRHGKRKNCNFDAYDTVEGQIRMVTETQVRINRKRMYEITFWVPYHAGEAYEVSKSFVVPAHILHTLAIGSMVTLKINPHKKKDVYLVTAYGIL